MRLAGLFLGVALLLGPVGCGEPAPREKVLYIDDLPGAKRATMRELELYFEGHHRHQHYGRITRGKDGIQVEVKNALGDTMGTIVATLGQGDGDNPIVLRASTAPDRNWPGLAGDLQTVRLGLRAKLLDFRGGSPRPPSPIAPGVPQGARVIHAEVVGGKLVVKDAPSPRVPLSRTKNQLLAPSPSPDSELWP